MRDLCHGSHEISTPRKQSFWNHNHEINLICYWEWKKYLRHIQLNNFTYQEKKFHESSFYDSKKLTENYKKKQGSHHSLSWYFIRHSAARLSAPRLSFSWHVWQFAQTSTRGYLMNVKRSRRPRQMPLIQKPTESKEKMWKEADEILIITPQLREAVRFASTLTQCLPGLS